MSGSVASTLASSGGAATNIMRHFLALTLALLVAGCAWRGSGPNPARYPSSQSVATGSYCVIALQTPRANGIVIGCSPTPTNHSFAHPRTIDISGPAPRHFARNPRGPAPPPLKVGTSSRRIGTGITWNVQAHALSVQERIDRDCMAYVSRPPIQGKFQALMFTDHSARVSRSAWDSASPQDRNQLIWDIAIHNGCVERRPELLTIRIHDEAGQTLRIQRVSTALDCHGDIATEYPGQIWYRC